MTDTPIPERPGLIVLAFDDGNDITARLDGEDLRIMIRTPGEGRRSLRLSAEDTRLLKASMRATASLTQIMVMMEAEAE